MRGMGRQRPSQTAIRNQPCDFRRPACPYTKRSLREAPPLNDNQQALHVIRRGHASALVRQGINTLVVQGGLPRTDGLPGVKRPFLLGIRLLSARYVVAFRCPFLPL